MSVNTTEKRKLTPPEIAGRFGVDVMKVLAWIKTGELRAINGATRIGDRPRYLVDVADLEEFEARRAVVPAPPKSTRQRAPRAAEISRNFR